MVTKLKYGNTNTYFIRGAKGSILLDTDYAGTLQMFYKEIKKNGISLKDITYILATHYHPDHMGLVGELVSMGVKFLVMDTQVPNLHFSDGIFSRDKTLRFLPSVPEDKAEVVACKDSRAFLHWISVLLPDARDDVVKFLINVSFEATKAKNRNERC